MGMLAWLAGALSPQPACSPTALAMYGSFVDFFVDSIFLERPAGSEAATHATFSASCANGASDASTSVSARVDAPGGSADQKPPLPTVLPAAERLIAIGDLHGDYPKAIRAFRLAGLIDEKERWVAGSTVAVQVGDILDRGDDEIKLLYFLERLQQEAAAAGGALYVLNGNHETMNVAGDDRYATAGAYHEMQRWHRWQDVGAALKRGCNCSHAMPTLAELKAAAAAMKIPLSHAGYNPLRAIALQPAGPITTRFFAKHPTVLQVGSTLFVHGGVLPSHAEYGLERINTETQDWLLGKSGDKAPSFLRGSNAVVWARDYSMSDERSCDCDKLRQVLGAVPGAGRMVVGHTIQKQGINAACGGRVYRVDVGLSKNCIDGAVEVLEILNDTTVRRLTERGAPLLMADANSVVDSKSSQQAAGEAQNGRFGELKRKLRRAVLG